MRLAVIVVFIGIVSFTPKLYSQESLFSITIDNATIKQVFKEIERNSDYRFFYNDDLTELNKIVSLKIDKKGIDSIMNTLLDGLKVSYNILTNNLIVISPNEYLLKHTRVSGTVYDAETGEPLPGVNISIEGTTFGTITNMIGYYSVECPEGSRLLFSFVGFETAKLVVKGVLKHDVFLRPTITDLKEIIVIGYNTQEFINVTGSVAQIKNKEFEDIPVSTTTNSITGRLPGVIVTNSGGEPGYDGASISIRGFGSPLVIVDGVETSFERVDPEDIENISVLKDGSAAIYGARAGNGVILVTTKRGQISEKPEITLSSSFGYQGQTVMLDFVDALDYMTLANEYYGREIYDSSDFQPYLDGTKQSTDWYNTTFRKYAPIWESNLLVRGGNEKVRYYLSYGNLDQRSILKSDDTRYSQNNFKSNIDVKINKSFNVSFDINGRIESREFPRPSRRSIFENIHFASPLFPAVFPDPSYPSYGGKGMGTNYYTRKDITGYITENYRFFKGSLSINYSPAFIKGLTAKVFTNFLTAYKTKNTWNKDYSYYTYNPETDAYTEKYYSGKDVISLKKEFNKKDQITAQFSLKYTNSFGPHQISAFMLNEIIDKNSDYLSLYREDYISSGIEQIFFGGEENDDNYGKGTQDGRISYAGRFSYIFKNKYITQLTFRIDGTPRFYQKYRYGFFPGISLGWILSEEKFLNKFNSLNFLKLRLSYGQMGDDSNGNFEYLTGYKKQNNYVFGTDNTIYTGLKSLGLENLTSTWETMTIYNAGIDISLWNRKLYSSFDLFYRYRDDILADSKEVSTPYSFGADLPVENINSQDNRGFELLVGHENTKGALRYYFSGNISYQRAKWDHFEEETFVDDETRNRLQQSGQWVNRIFGLEAIGIFDSTTLANSVVDHDPGTVAINSSIKPGDIQYLDYNGDSVINEKDEHVIGKGNRPEILYGLDMGINYKGFDISLLWQGATNFNIYFRNEAQKPFFNGAVPYKIHLERWTTDNPDPDAKYPRSSNNSNNYKYSSFWLHDGTYLRLKNVQIGYTFTDKSAGKLNISKARIYFSGFNIFTLSNVYPYDPETPNNSRGWDYPLHRTFALGVELTF